MTNAVDPGLLAAVACRANGLGVTSLSAPTLGRLEGVSIRHVLEHGVVDLRPTATPADYREALAAVAADPGADSVLVIFMPPLVRAVDEVASAILDGTREAGGKPVVASFMSQFGLPAGLRDGERAIPSYVFPERAVAALGRAAAYGRWRREPAGVIAYPDGIDRKAARELLTRSGPGWLSAADSGALLRLYGITVAGTKAAQRAGDTARGVLRVRADPLVGPVISFCLAGVFSELFGDVATGVTPLTDRDARELLAALRAFPMLTGAYRDDPGDLPAIEDTLLRLSALIEDLPAVTEVTIDPLLIGRPGEGVAAVSPAVHIGGGWPGAFSAGDAEADR